jgi:hypothetical protein
MSRLTSRFLKPLGPINSVIYACCSIFVILYLTIDNFFCSSVKYHNILLGLRDILFSSKPKTICSLKICNLFLSERRVLIYFFQMHAFRLEIKKKCNNLTPKWYHLSVKYKFSSWIDVIYFKLLNASMWLWTDKEYFILLKNTLKGAQ